MGQLRAQSCVMLRDGGRGTRCLRVSIVRSTTQTLHHRHALTLNNCRVWNHPDSSPQTYDDGDVVSPMNPRTLCSHWPAGVWAESTAGQQRGPRRPISPSRSGRDLRVHGWRPCWAPARVHTCLSASQVRTRTWKHTWKNGVKHRQRKNQRSSECGTKNNTRLCHKVTRLF